MATKIPKLPQLTLSILAILAGRTEVEVEVEVEAEAEEKALPKVGQQEAEDQRCRICQGNAKRLCFAALDGMVKQATAA